MFFIFFSQYNKKIKINKLINFFVLHFLMLLLLVDDDDDADDKNLNC